ncbi:MAG: cation diffusion facilitator family transporter [Candidatus Edwardsbacteria bacterium]
MTTPLSQSQREKRSVAFNSMLAAVFLTAMKLIVGLITGSLGILAEAAHSALDLGATVITCLAVRVSDKPADAEHQYGHGKIESFSALIEVLFLLVTCGWIMVEAIDRISGKGFQVQASWIGFLTMGISITVDISRAKALSKMAKKYQSQALEADALHFSNDVWSSLTVKKLDLPR